MQDVRKKHGANAGRSAHEQSARGAIRDPGAERLLRMGGAVGNDELLQRLQRGNASRDELLAHLCTRLEAMREAQQREVEAGLPNAMRDHWKGIADEHKAEIVEPEPTRWHEAAGTYEQAAYQLCRGDLAQGHQLMERAIAQEQAAFDAVSAHIDVGDLRNDEAAPVVGGDVALDAPCTPVDAPPEVGLAREIQNVTQTAPSVPWRPRTRDPWWTLEEDEEEETAPEGSG